MKHHPKSRVYGGVWWGNGLLSVPCFFGTTLLNPPVAPVLSQQHLGITAPSGIGREAGLEEGNLNLCLPSSPAFLCFGFG